MKVYVVTSFIYGTREVHGVFAKEEDAREFIEGKEMKRAFFTRVFEVQG